MCLKERMLGFLPRLEKPQALLAEGKVHPVLGKEGLFVVESQEGKGHYLVDLEAETCTCPAFAQGKMRPCKHHFRDNGAHHITPDASERMPSLRDVRHADAGTKYADSRSTSTAASRTSELSPSFLV